MSSSFFYLAVPSIILALFYLTDTNVQFYEIMKSRKAQYHFKPLLFEKLTIEQAAKGGFCSLSLTVIKVNSIFWGSEWMPNNGRSSADKYIKDLSLVRRGQAICRQSKEG